MSGETITTQEHNEVIEHIIPWIKKKIEKDIKTGKSSFNITKKIIGDDNTLNLLFKDTTIVDKLEPQLESLGLKVIRNKNPQDTSTYESLLITWEEDEDVSQEEGEETFEVPEEEVEETETTELRRAPEVPFGATSGRQQQNPPVKPSRRIGARLRVQPRPPETKQIELSQIQNLRKVLENIPIQRIAYENWIRKRLVLVGNNQPLERALSRINKHNILSIPVVDVSSPVGAVVGLLDVLDIVSTVSEATRPRRDLLTIPISNIMAKEGRSPTYLISTQASLYDAVQHFAQSGLPRAMIVDRQLPNNEPVIVQTEPEERVVGLLTQADIMRFLAENFMWMKQESIFRFTLGELGLGNRKPVVVEQSIPAYKAFMEIHQNGRDGVAMTDSSGKIVSNLSASNIKGMTRTNFQLLFRPLTVYLSRDRKRGWWQLPVCTTLDTSLEYLVLQFVSTKVHRMYITDTEGKPVGEVNLTDIMKQLHVL